MAVSCTTSDLLRKRHRNEGLQLGTVADPSASAPDKDRTATIERLADAAAMDLDDLFETEWQTNLLEAALETISPNLASNKFKSSTCMPKRNGRPGMLPNHSVSP